MEKPTKRTVSIPAGHGFKTRPMEFYHPTEVDAYIAHLDKRAEAAVSDCAKWKEEAIKAHEESEIVLARLAKLEESGRKLSLEWVYEDELPDGYPYDEMFPFSKVDIVRMFPIFVTVPAHAADLAEIVPEDLNGKSLSYIADKFQVSISEAQFILVGFNACRTTILRKIEERN